MVLCTKCNRNFAHMQALHAHYRAKADHHHCTECKRFFMHKRALEQHLQDSPAHGMSKRKKTKSRAHPKTKNVPKIDRKFRCPLCGGMFKFPSSIALHIESGACNNISRHQVTSAIHALNVIPRISLSHRIAGPGGLPGGTIVHYSANRQAFNGFAYECYFCHRTFHTLASLNAHLGSAAHDEDQFKCPRCNKTFKLISGLIQHVESETCGAARFKQVEDMASRMTGQFARLLRF